ncbi:MAG: 50S ribosomal protein L17 [Candidatus Omnitrophica bacterium]|nr:50S ribosomal protein L17 [Candidatus Omnitrophota bacterium]
MRHAKLNKRLGRNYSQRRQLIRSLVRGLFISHSIKTTLIKAKQARRLADKIISYAKSATLKDIRAIDAILQDKALTRKLVSVLAPLSKNRSGGYTRIIRLGFRRGDGAQTAVLELTDIPEQKKKEKKLKDKKAAQAAVESPAEPVEGAVKQSDGRKTAQSKPSGKDEITPKPARQDGKPSPAKKPKLAKDIEKKNQPRQGKGIIGKFKRFFDK